MTNTAAATAEQTRAAWAWVRQAVFGQGVPAMRRDLGNCAVVVDGSMAGLRAARVLAEQFAIVGGNHRSTRDGGVGDRARGEYGWR